MEAWLAGTLVIANGGGEVNRWHCERSGAGLLYDDDLELEECLRFVAEAPETAARSPRPERLRVEHASWPNVLDRVEARSTLAPARPKTADAGPHRWGRVRMLLVADYPPPYGPVADITVAEVRTLRALGDHLEVCSPTPSAAHHHRDLRSAPVSSRWHARSPADRVLVRLQDTTRPPVASFARCRAAV